MLRVLSSSKNLFQNRYLSVASKRPQKAKPTKERFLEKNKDFAENAPTTTKVIIWWHTAPQWKKLLLGTGIFITVFQLFKWYYGMYTQYNAQQANVNKSRTYGELSVGGPFELVDTQGNIVSTETLKGKWALLYFGFTYCPDICPEQMEMMGDLVDIAKEEHDIDITPIMITIDLERDTPEVLEEYVQEYNSKIVGLLGTEQQIDDVCNLYRCYRSKGQAYDDPLDYILDHTVTQYLVNPEGKTVGYFMSNRSLEERIPILIDYVTKYNESKKPKEEPSIVEKVKQWLRDAQKAVLN